MSRSLCAAFPPPGVSPLACLPPINRAQAAAPAAGPPADGDAAAADEPPVADLMAKAADAKPGTKKGDAGVAMYKMLLEERNIKSKMKGAQASSITACHWQCNPALIQLIMPRHPYVLLARGGLHPTSFLDQGADACHML